MHFDRREAEGLAQLQASEQFGALSDAQLLAFGFTRHDISYRVLKRLLTPELPGVKVVAGSPRSWHRNAMCACLHAGDEAALSGAAAARNWGADGFEAAGIEVSTTNRKCRGRLLPDGSRVRFRRVDEHLLPEISDVGGIPTTSARRTILDLCGQRHTRSSKALFSLLRRGQVDLGQLWLYLDQEWQRGRRGVRILRDLLIPLTDDYAMTDSDLEVEARTLIDAFGLPQPIHQYPEEISTGKIFIDMAYPEAMLAIEVDSRLHHLNPAAFDADRNRDVELQLKGWVVMRLTFAMIRYQRARIANAIRAHLARHNRV